MKYNQLSTEIFIKKSKQIHGDVIDHSKVIYINNRTPVILICLINGHGEFNQRPDNHLSGKGCPKCGNNKISVSRKKSEEEILRKIISKHSDRYDYDKFIYNGYHIKSIITCLKENHGDFKQSPANHLKGAGCPKCGILKAIDSTKSNKEIFVRESNLVHHYRYDYSEVNYINSITKVKIKCNICLLTFEQTPSAHLAGQGCPHCIESKGERFISRVLKENHIEYIREYRLPESNALYRYDFYLPEFNLLIEFHGKQHYKPIDFFGGEEAFKETQFRDTMKKALAKETGRNLICIHYKYMRRKNLDNFKELLLKEIHKHDKK